MSDTVVLNDFTTLNYKELRTRKKFLVTIQAEPLVHNFDVRQLGKGPAEAIAQFLREQIEAVNAPASPNTIRARESAERAFVAGKQWAIRRYSGGRTGSMAPNTSTRQFNDSGRFSQTLIASPRQKDGRDVWIINVAANRLDGRTLDNGGDAAVPEVFRRLALLVPALSDPNQLLAAPGVRTALEQSMTSIIAKLNRQADAKAWALARQALGLIRTAWSFG